MKKGLIVALVALNVALLAWVLAKTAPTAYAAGGQKPGDYMMVTARYGNTTSTVFIVDTQKERMTAWWYDLNRKRMLPTRAISLTKDFKK